jgi:hypothetical protein
MAAPGAIERNLNPLLRVAVYCVQYSNSGDFAAFRIASTQKLNATTEGFRLVLAKVILAKANVRAPLILVESISCRDASKTRVLIVKNSIVKNSQTVPATP